MVFLRRRTDKFPGITLTSGGFRGMKAIGGALVVCLKCTIFVLFVMFLAVLLVMRIVYAVLRFLCTCRNSISLKSRATRSRK